MPAKTTPLGPGTITVGETGSEVDFSCQITGAVVAWDVNADDDVPTLCGDVVPGDRTYTSTLSGTLYQDLADAAGIVAFSWANRGLTVPFTFTPHTDTGTSVAGMLTIDPLDVGGDTAPEKMTSDFEWAIVGQPTLTIPPAVPPGADAAASRGELVGA